MTAIHDLRSWLDILEKAGQLVRVRREVNLVHELAAVAAALERQGGPAPLFESVTGSSWPIFSSSVANQERAALALGCEKSQVTEAMRQAIDPANGIAPVRVEDAAWKANVLTGDAIDVHKVRAGGELLDVRTDFGVGLQDGCSADSPVLNRMACLLRAWRVFDWVLTPDFNREHDNHFHLDIYCLYRRRFVPKDAPELANDD